MTADQLLLMARTLTEGERRRLLRLLAADAARQAKARRLDRRNEVLHQIITERQLPIDGRGEWKVIGQWLQLLDTGLALVTRRQERQLGTVAAGFLDFVSPRSLETSYRAWLLRQPAERRAIL